MPESPVETTTAAASTTARPKPRRGFAAMDPATLRAVCSQGGKNAHAHGTAHRFNPEEASKAGKKGGARVATDRAYMAAIGQRGGFAKRGYRERQAAQQNVEASATNSAR